MSTPGGNTGQPDVPAPGGSQRLHVDPASIGAAKQAFSEALDGVQQQLRRIQSAHQQPWAGDPVSAETAQAINNRTKGGAEEFNAENVLLNYARQLSNVVEGLQRTERTYRDSEDDNAAMWHKHAREGGGQ